MVFIQVVLIAGQSQPGGCIADPALGQVGIHDEYMFSVFSGGRACISSTGEVGSSFLLTLFTLGLGSAGLSLAARILFGTIWSHG